MLEHMWTYVAEVVLSEWNRFTWAAVCAGSTFGVIVFLHASGALLSLERATLDARFQHANRPGDVDTSIVLATVDERSISFFRRNMQVGWPWPREYYATLVRYLEKGGARAVVFDILFSEEDFDRRNVSAQSSDRQFASAIQETGNVALAVQLRETDSLKNPIKSAHRLSDRPLSWTRLPTYPGAMAPLPSFQEGAAAIGGVNIKADPDGVVRRFPLAFRMADSLALPSLGLAALQASRSASHQDYEALFSRLPSDRDGSLPLYWYGPGGVEGVFEDQYISIHSLIVSAARMQIGRPPIVSPDRFRGKTVVVGGTAATLHDLHATPVAQGADYPGMEIIATFLSNAYQSHFLRDLPAPWTYVLVFVMALLGPAAVALRPGRIRVATAATVGAVVGYLALATAAFYFWRWWIPVVAPTLALLTGFFTMAAISYAAEGRKRRKLRNVFQRYVSPQVVDEVAQQPDKVRLGGEEVEGTIFFSDIEDFTSVAEELTPQEVVQRLNNYFGIATKVILNHEAMVDKFIGDAIMAVFGAPVRRPNHATEACLAALEMRRDLLNAPDQLQREELPPFQCRIGIHTGQVVVGNVGTPERVDYTAIGDAVNVAARLEQANKQYDTRMLVSHPTYQQAKRAVVAREIDHLRLTGKETPIRIYELLGREGELSTPQKQLKDRFEEGLRIYRAQEFARARDVFKEILRAHPNDGPSAVYGQRAEQRLGTSLPRAWKGVHDMKGGK